MFSLLPALALLAPVLAQSGSTTVNGSVSTVDIEGIEANFQQAQLVPELLSTFDPEGILTVEFSGSSISTGQNLTEDAVSSSPTLSVSPASNATLDSGALYTVIMVDANPVGTDESTTEQTRHWLVNSAQLSVGSTAPYTVNWTGSTSITDYAGPGPASGSGSHRYVILIYDQPSTFTAPSNLSTAGTALGTMYLSSYVSESGLGDLVAANYFQVEVGVATSTVESTTAVDSTTLAGYGSTTVTSAASGTATSSASGSKTASASATSSTATSSSTAKSGAMGRKDFGWGIVVGGLGVVGAVVGAGLGL